MALKAAPNELVWLARTPQPWLPVCAAAQLVPPTTEPVIPSTVEFPLVNEQPGFVWIVAWLFVYVFTPTADQAMYHHSIGTKRTFDDIYLSARRPVRAIAPERRPRTAASRHVDRVHNDQAARVCLRGRYPDALARVGDLWSRLHAHDRMPGAVYRCEVRRLLEMHKPLVMTADSGGRRTEVG